MVKCLVSIKLTRSNCTCISFYCNITNKTHLHKQIPFEQELKVLLFQWLDLRILSSRNTGTTPVRNLHILVRTCCLLDCMSRLLQLNNETATILTTKRITPYNFVHSLGGVKLFVNLNILFAWV